MLGLKSFKGNIAHKARLTKTKVANKWDKDGAKISIYAGTFSLVAGGVALAYQTTKLDKIKKENEAKIKEVDEYLAENPAGIEYTPEDAANDKKIINSKSALEVVKLYAGPVLMMAGGVAMIMYGTKTMTGKIATLTSTLATTNEFWQRYRKRVQGVLDKKTEEDIYYDRKYTEDPNVIDEKTGKPVTRLASQGRTPYQIEWNRVNADGTLNSKFDGSDDISNWAFVRSLEQTLTNELQLRAGHNRVGFIFLPEIYSKYGFDLGNCPPGSEYVGWSCVLGDDGRYYSPAGGDAVVKFRIPDIHDVLNVTDFIDIQRGDPDHQASAIILDPNYDGNLKELYEAEYKKWTNPKMLFAK